MSMIEMQTTIARLCIDSDFRKTFLSDPGAALEPLDLTPEEVENIKALDMKEVTEYASSLVAKRIGIIMRWFRVPLTYLNAVLGPARVNRLLRTYSVDHIRDTDELGGEWVRLE